MPTSRRQAGAVSVTRGRDDGGKIALGHVGSSHLRDGVHFLAGGTHVAPANGSETNHSSGHFAGMTSSSRTA